MPVFAEPESPLRNVGRHHTLRPAPSAASQIEMHRSSRLAVTLIVLLVSLGVLGDLAFARHVDVYDRVRDGYADSDGVRIHYATLGHGPLVVMIHGFPDFWYTWRKQMEALSDRYQVVAIDQRGYNLSDKPKGVESYDMPLLVG